MLGRLSVLATVAILFAVVVLTSVDAAEELKQLPVPEMKFNDVKEIASAASLSLLVHLR